jgi:uncharacterized repeat protein (TIGR01451 family)
MHREVVVGKWRRGSRLPFWLLALPVVLMAALSLGTNAPPPLGAPPALAQGGLPVPFACTTATNFLAQDGEINRQVFADGAVAFDPLGPPPATNSLNAVGFNDLDGFLYGISRGTGLLYRIGENNVSQVVTPNNLGVADSVVGAIAPGTDEFYVAGPGPNELTSYDIGSQAVNFLRTLSEDWLPNDWTFANGRLWGAENGEIWRLNPANGNVARFPQPVGASFPGAVGAAYTLPNGDIALGANNGALTIIRVTNPTTASPSFQVIGVFSGPSSQNNDGASCPGLPLDVQITKTGPATAPVGSQVTWDLVVRNNGPGGINGYTVVDEIPAGVTNVSSDTAACQIIGSTLSCALGQLASGATRTIRVTGTLPNTVGTCVTNVTEVTPIAVDTNPANNRDQVETCTAGPPDLQLEKVTDAPTTRPAGGGGGTFTLTARNTGGSPTTAPITINDVAPAQMGFTATSGTGWSCGPTPSTNLTCTNNAVLQPGQAAPPLVITYALAPGILNNTTLTNTATVGGGGDGVPGNNTGTSTVTVVRQADVSVTKQRTSAATVAPGGLVTYDIVVANAGPSDSGPIELDDSVTGGLTLTAAGGPCALPFPCTIAPLAPGASVTVPVTARAEAAAAGTTQTNTASIDPGPTDTTPGNDTTPPVAVQVGGDPDLEITKTVGSPTIVGGGAPGTFTLTARNSGNVPTSGTVTVTDTLPAPLSPGTPSGTGWSCSVAGQTVTCTRTTPIAAGASAPPITIPFTAPANTGIATVTNVATVGGGGEPVGNQNNNNDDVTVTTRLESNVSVTKTRTSAATVAPGGTVTYAIVVANAGPSASGPIELDDQVSGGLTITGASGGGCTLPFPCTLASLNPGASVTVNVTATVAAGAANTTQTNVATIDPGPNDTTPGNDTTPPVGVTVGGLPDLEIAKTVGSPTIVGGGAPGTFTLTARNTGTAATTGTVTVTDTLPAPLSPGTPSGTGWTCSVAGQTVTCTRTTAIPAGGQAPPITIPFTAPANTGIATVTNVATVGGGGEPVGNQNNNNDDVDVRTRLNFDVSVTKSAAPTSILPGQTTTFTVVVRNDGPSFSGTTALNETLPANLELVSVASTPGGLCNATTADCAIPALAPGGQVTLTIVMRAPATLSQATTATNAVAITPATSADAIDTDTGNHTATAAVQVQPVAVLQSSKRVVDPPLVRGATGTYRYVVENVGGAAATDVSFTDPMPTGLVALSADGGPNWTCTVANLGTGVSCSYDVALAAGATAPAVTITVRVAADAPATIRNVQTTTCAQPCRVDPDNPPTVPVTSQADVSIVKTASPNPVRALQPVTYTLTVTNAGPSTATNVEASDTLPAGLNAPTSVTANGGGTCAGQTTATPSCTWASIPAGQTRVMTIVVPAEQGATGAPQVNRAAVDSDTPDPTPGNDEDTVTVRVVSPNLVVTKDLTSARVVRGAQVDYRVRVTNEGDAPATASTTAVVDTFPAGLTPVSASGTGWTCQPPAGQTITCQRTNAADVLAPGASWPDLTVRATVAQNAPATLSNRVAVQVPPGQPNDPTDDTDTTPPAPVVDDLDLSVTKTVTPATVRALASATYTITVANAGPTDARNVSVADVLAPGLDQPTSVVASGGGTCTGTTTRTCTWATIPAGQSRTVTIVVPAEQGAVGTPQVNRATIDADNIAADRDDDDHEAQATVTVISPDLTTTKTLRSELVRGTQAAYGVVVRNVGTDVAIAGDTAVVDTVPTGLTNPAGTGTGWTCTTMMLTVRCERTNPADTLAPGASWPEITITAQVAQTAPATAANTATVQIPPGQPDVPGNNGDTTPPAPVTDRFDLSVTKSATPKPVRAQSNVTYTITVANSGPSQANDVAVSDELALGIDQVSSITASGGGVCTGTATRTCRWTTIGPNETRTVTIVAPAELASRDTDQTNRASLTADNIDGDTTPGNNTTTETVRIVSPDLTVDKRLTSRLVRGTPATFELTVTNAGTATAVGGATTRDVLADGFQNPVATGQGWTCTTTVRQVDCARTNAADTLAPGASYPPIRVTADVALDAPVQLGNSATVAGPVNEPDPPANNTDATPPTAVVSEVDLRMVKTASPDSILATQQTTYTLVVSNNGPSVAEDVVVDDVIDQTLMIPVSATVVTAGPGRACATTPAPYRCALGDLQPGARVEIRIVAEARNARPPAESTVTNVATVTSPTTELDPSDNTDRTDVEVRRTSDLLTVKTKVTGQPVAGDLVDFRILVTNLGPSDAVDTVVEDDIPPQIDPATVTVQADVPATCRVAPSGTKLACDVPLIEAGEAATITFRGKLRPDTAFEELTNTARAINDDDPEDGNNESTTPPDEIEERSDLRSTKTGPATVKADGQITYTLKAENLGPSDAPEAVLTDELPEGTTFVSIDPDCPVQDRTVRCALGTLKAGASVTYTVVVDTQLQQAEQTLTNRMALDARPPDPNPANDTSTVTTKVDPASDLQVRKEAPRTAVAEEDLTYVVTVTNAGPSASPNSTFTDTLPADTVLVGAAPPQGTCAAPAADRVVCDLGTLAAGQSVAVPITVRPTKAASNRTITNRVVVDGPNDDPTPGNDRAEVPVEVRPPLPDLQVTKRRLTGGTRVVGDEVTFEVVAANRGNGPATNAVVRDVLPEELAYVSATTSAGSCAGGQTVVCSVGTVQPGAAVTVRVVTRLRAGGSVTNRATASSDEPDKNPADNTATVITGSSVAPVGRVTKRAGSRTAARGSTVDYRITVRNPGPGRMRDAQLCDRLPSGLTYVAGSARPAARLRAGVLCWTLRNLPAGASRTVRLKARVAADARRARLTNIAVLSASGMRPVRGRATVPVRGSLPQRPAGVTG